MIIRSLLVDDEIDSIRVLQNLLETHCPEIEIIGEADSIDTAVQAIQDNTPDLLFLDIALVHESGFDLLNRLAPVNFQVIFVTGLDEHALRAFRYSAVDYLLKPVDAKELRRAVDKAAGRKGQHTLLNRLNVLANNISALQLADQKMAIPMSTGLEFAYLKDIIRFEAQGSYTNIILLNGTKTLSTRSLSEYEEILPTNIFCRVHHSHIVNINWVKRYLKGRGGYLIMEDQSQIDVSIRRKEEFLSRVLK